MDWSSGGAYEDIFGVAVVLEDEWSDEVFYGTLVAIIFFKKIKEKAKEIAKEKNYKQIGRMKFFILALASVYTKKRLDSFLHKKFLDNKKLCKKTWDDFRKNAKHPIL